MATRVIAAQDKTSSGAGDDVQIKAGNANTSGAGGSIILQPGVQVTTGGDGVIQVKSASGVNSGKIQGSAGDLKIMPESGKNVLIYDGYNGGGTNVIFQTNQAGSEPRVNMPLGVSINSFNFISGSVYAGNYATLTAWNLNLGFRGAGYAVQSGVTGGNEGVLRVTAGDFSAGGSIAYASSTPTALSTNPTNDLVLTGSAFQRLSSSSALSVTGIAPPATGAHVDGRLIWLYNVGSFNITLKHSQTSTAANQFINEGSGDIVLGPGRMVQAIYDSTSSKWRVNGETYPYVFPTADGTNGQVLTTNGSGTLSWTTPTGGVTGTGTTGNFAKFTSSTAVGNSVATETTNAEGYNIFTYSGQVNVGSSIVGGGQFTRSMVVANATKGNAIEVTKTVADGNNAAISASSAGSWIGAFYSTATTTKGLMVRGASGQTANLQEWQGNTGTVLASIDSSGKLVHGYNSASGLSTFSFAKTVLGGVHFVNGAGSGTAARNEAAITFQGTNSTEAQAGIYVINDNSSGTHMAFATTDSYATGPQLALTITNTGVANFPRARPTFNGANLVSTSGGTTGYYPRFTDSATLGNSITFDNGTNVGIGTASPNGKLEIVPAGSSGAEGIYINQGASHQSTIRFKSAHSINSDYRIGASILVDSAFEIYSVNAAATRMLVTSTGNVGIGTTSPGAKLQVDTGATGTKGQIIKAFLGQSANLSEWQDSTGTVVAAVSPTGAFTGSSFTPYGTFNSTTTIFGNNYWTPNLSGVSNPSTGTFTKTAGTLSWDSQAYSSEGYTKNVYCAARASQTNGYIMFGLNSDPATDANYSSLDYAWYFRADGIVEIYENNIAVSTYGSYTTSTVLSITYDGSNVQYWKDGVIQRTVARSTGNPLYFDTSFYSTGASLNAVQFGPIGQPFGISGTAGYHPKFTSQQTLGNSIVYDNGTNVGIGTTTNLSDTVNIYENAAPIIRFQTSGNQFGARIGFWTGTGMQIQCASANFPIVFQTAGTINNNGYERMRITHDGLIGIGTASPGGLLDVQQSNAGDMLVRAWNTNTAGTGKSIIRVANSGNNAQGQQIQFSDNNYYTGTVSSDRTNGMSFYVGQMATPLTSERVRIDTSGNVGVGAGARIGSGTGYINAGATAAGYLELYNATSGATTLMNTGAFNVLVGTNNTERIRVTSSGLVGIGTSTIAGNNPLADLHVNDASGYGSLQLSQSPAGATIDTGGEIQFAATYRSTSDLTQVARIRGLRENATNNNWAGYLAFYTSTGSDNPSASTERMRINSSGNVGIGTASPSFRLQVDAASVDANIVANVTSGYGGIGVYAAGTNKVILGYVGANTNYGSQTVAGDIALKTNNSNLHINTGSGNSVTTAYFSSGGNVGIGTVSPSAKLDVAGWGRFGTGGASQANLLNITGGSYNQVNITSGNNWGLLLGHGDGSQTGNYHGTNVAAIINVSAAALHLGTSNASRMMIDSAGNVGINNTSPGAKLQVDTGATGTKGQIIKAFLGQSANLSEWQSSTGTALGYINSDMSQLVTPATFTLGSQSNNSGVVELYSGTVRLRPSSLGNYIFTLTQRGVDIGAGVGDTVPVLKVTRYADGNVGPVAQFVTGSTTHKGLVITGVASQTGNLQEWQNSSGTALAYMDANGNFAAVTKSFLIPHPTPAKAAEGKKLRYASLEGPENGVYFRGRLEGENVIILPDYWVDLVDPDSITVNLTARKFAQPSLFVVDANAERVVIDSDREINCDFVVFATRRDIAKLEVEPDGN